AGSLVDWYTDRRLPGARTSGIARTKFIDDALLGFLQANVQQIVILGAGFDCRAYRLPQLNSTTIFEVDHPSTLASKLGGLRQMLPEIPDHVRFVEIDFNHQELSEVLARSGFQLSSAAIFVWEGVTHYLSPAAVDSVLQYVATCHPGTRLIFTYIHAGLLDGSVEFDGAAPVLRDVARLSEPWTFGLVPGQVVQFLRERGLHLERDLSAREYRRQYFGAEAERMRGYDFYHVAIACVPE
ncbi:MAG TPA: SAM-dependent methyltransferase, partial [Candidatus Acidoferrum sp.]|nr:SAM-dependent methyltransferase [Candidatus Acidoferrum sp.]